MLRDKGALSGGSGVRELPARGPGGVRCKGGVSSLQALVWNRRICRFDTYGRLCPVRFAPGVVERGEAQAAKATRVRVPMRGTEADPLVVATKAL